MQCPLLLNHISFWILKDIFVPHTHMNSRKLSHILSAFFSKWFFFPFWRNCSSVYQFYCPFCYNFKTEFRVTAKSKPFFLAQFFAANFKILIVCSCFILHALWLDFFQKKVVSLKKDYDRKNKKSNIKNLKLSTKLCGPNVFRLFSQWWQVKNENKE